MPTVWPFAPMDGYSETLEWNTEVLGARADEQRRARRGAPRQGFSGSYAMDAQQYSRARAIIYGQYDQEILLPVWPELTRVGAISSGAGSIALDTGEADYRAGGQALVWDSDAAFEAVEILSVGGSSLTLDGTLDNNYEAALVMPLRRAMFMNTPSAGRKWAGYSELSAEVEVIDNLDLAASIGLPTYRSMDVMTDAPLLSAGLSDDIRILCEDVDNGVGPRVRSEWQRWIDETATLAWDMPDRTAKWRRGQQKKFWVPTWNADLNVLSNIVPASTAIGISPIGWPNHYGQRDIMIRSTSGVDHYLRVESGSLVGDQEVLTLEAAAGFTLAAANIEFACLLLPMRLAADRISIDHEAGGAARCSVPATSVPLPA